MSNNTNPQKGDIEEAKLILDIIPKRANVISQPRLDPKDNWAEFFLVERTDPEARMPERAEGESVGYDVFSFEKFIVPANSRVLHNLKLIIRPPKGHYARIAPRSGLALNNGIDVLAGVVDRDYRKEVGVILYNTSVQDKKFEKHEKIAQIILEKAAIVPIKEVAKVADFDKLKTLRTGGFGSTDKK